MADETSDSPGGARVDLAAAVRAPRRISRLAVAMLRTHRATGGV